MRRSISLVGGNAVGAHGYPRNTNDMDVWVEMSAENAMRLVTVLRRFGFDVPESSAGNHRCRPVSGTEQRRTGDRQHHARQADQDVHDAGQRRILSAKQRRDKIEIERADQAPIQGANNDKNERCDVKRFH